MLTYYARWNWLIDYLVSCCPFNFWKPVIAGLEQTSDACMVVAVKYSSSGSSAMSMRFRWGEQTGDCLKWLVACISARSEVCSWSLRGIWRLGLVVCFWCNDAWLAIREGEPRSDTL